MSISNETKELVAAQLTQAWASTADAGQRTTDIHEIYTEFLQLLNGHKPAQGKSSVEFFK